MAGENQQATVNPETAQAFAEYMARQFQQMEAADKQATDFQSQSREKINSAISDLMAKALMRSNVDKGPRYSAEVIAIANALQAQPILIPAVDAYLKKLVVALDRAWREVIAESVGGLDSSQTTETPA